MKTIDLQAIREQLPHGSMTKIANTLGIDVRIVSRVFDGEIKNYRNQVLNSAFSLLESYNEQQKTLNEKARKYGFLTDFIFTKKKKKNMKPREDVIELMDVFGRDEEELIDLIEENDLETDPGDHKKLLGGYNVSLWNAVAIECGLYPTWEELHEMDRVDLENLIEEMALEDVIDLDDYEDDTDGNKDLAKAIADELDIEEEPEDEDEE